MTNLHSQEVPTAAELNELNSEVASAKEELYSDVFLVCGDTGCGIVFAEDEREPEDTCDAYTGKCGESGDSAVDAILWSEDSPSWERYTDNG